MGSLRLDSILKEHITSFTMHFAYMGAQWIVGVNKDWRSSHRIIYGQTKKVVSGNEAFLLGLTRNFNVRWCFNTAKPYIFATPWKASDDFYFCLVHSYWHQSSWYNCEKDMEHKNVTRWGNELHFATITGSFISMDKITLHCLNNTFTFYQGYLMLKFS